MGGRGGSYSRGASAASAINFQGLSDYMKNTYSVRVDPKLANHSFEGVRNAAAGMEEIFREFPGLVQTYVVHELNGNESGAHAYASASFGGALQINPDKWKDWAAMERSYQRDVKNGFHPEGSAKSVAIHEMGHLLERGLIDKNAAYTTRADRIIAWNKGKEATRIIGAAARIVKRTDKGATVNSLVSQVSRYATKNRSEALAECVADYVSNGSKAQPLSRAVWSILKKELG